MQTVLQLVQNKGNDIWSIRPDASVFDALKMMAEKEAGCLVVMAEGKVVGLITERDYSRKVILEGRSSHDTPVRDIMEDRVVYADQDLSVQECMALMTDKRTRHLPVMSEGELVGVVSIGDLVKAAIAEQQFVIEQLERYISL